MPEIFPLMTSVEPPSTVIGANPALFPLLWSLPSTPRLAEMVEVALPPASMEPPDGR